MQQATTGSLASLGGESMGTRWSARLYARPGADLHALHAGIQQQLDQVVAQMSTWEAQSDISRYRRAAAGSWQAIPEGFAQVLDCAIEVARASDGAFDPTLGPLVDLWGFGSAGTPRRVPSGEDIERARAQCGWQRLQRRAGGRELLQPGGLQLDLSAIAKGHGADLAAAHLRAHGIAAAESELLEADGRVFLQSTRFDRTSTLGRRGLVSLAALDAANYGHGRIDWWKFAPQLQRDGWLAPDDARTLALRGWFGALIGNSDMHLGNASLFLGDSRPLALAPSYDMLPMMLRPASTGEVVPRTLELVPPLPEQHALWSEAARMAQDFWWRVEVHAGISADMSRIAGEQARKLQTAISRFG